MKGELDESTSEVPAQATLQEKPLLRGGPTHLKALIGVLLSPVCMHESERRLLDDWFLKTGVLYYGSVCSGSELSSFVLKVLSEQCSSLRALCSFAAEANSEKRRLPPLLNDVDMPVAADVPRAAGTLDESVGDEFASSWITVYKKNAPMS